MHERIANHLNQCLQSGQVPSWMTRGKTVLIMKDKINGNVPSNYRPIACLPIVWKLFTGIISDKIYKHLLNCNILPNEQKGCRRGSRGTKDQLLIDKAIIRNSKRMSKNLAMAYIDYKKAFDMIPHSWLLRSLELVNVADNVRCLLSNSMKNWKVELTVDKEKLGEVSIRRGIFQGDSLSPLLFIIVLIPLSIILRQTNYGYYMSKESLPINHLLFMDDLKLYSRSEKELKSLVHTVRIFSDDIEMKFGLDKCKTVFLKRGKITNACSIEMPNGDCMSQIEDVGYKYLGMLQGEGIRTAEMKEFLEKEYIRRVRKLCKSKLYASNIISGINQWALGVIRYSAGIVDWVQGDLERIDRKTRKVLTCNGSFHPRANVARLYLKRREGGRGLLSVEHCVRSESNSLWDYVSNSEEPLLKHVLDENFMVDNKGKDEYDKEFKERCERNWKRKVLHGKFPESIKDVGSEETWLWLKTGWVKKNTEAIVTAAQDQALRTNWIKARIDGQDVSPLCRVCHEADESVMHIASGCELLAKRRYTIRHDLVAKRVHWELCRKYRIDTCKKWYDHSPPDSCLSDEGVEILWDTTINSQPKVRHNRPDIIVKTHSKWSLIDIAIPMDHSVFSKENEKLEKYTDLAGSIRTEHQVQTEIIPIIIGALGTIPKRLPNYLEKLELPNFIGSAQISVITSTAKILRDILSL